MKLEHLITNIASAHQHFHHRAVHQVNLSRTLRNWLIGFYLVEYEQEGKDGAEYGKRLYHEIENRINSAGIKGLGRHNLYRCVGFYRAYPQIVGRLSQQFQIADSERFTSNLPAPKTAHGLEPLSADLLFSRLNFSHFVELAAVVKA